jgi:hypothetical protein
MTPQGCDDELLVIARRSLEPRGAQHHPVIADRSITASLQGAQRRGNPGFRATAGGLLRSSQ